MTDLHMPELRKARDRDWDSIRALLDESGLPTDDLGPKRLDGFLVAEDDQELVGLIGLEVHGRIGLLRSLVVAKRARSAGLGGKLVGSLEAAAETAGLKQLWLLTIDAEKFFERHGYQIVTRETAPEAIQDTEEYRGLCPDSAYLMMKALDA